MPFRLRCPRALSFPSTSSSAGKASTLSSSSKCLTPLFYNLVLARHRILDSTKAAAIIATAVPGESPHPIPPSSLLVIVSLYSIISHRCHCSPRRATLLLPSVAFGTLLVLRRGRCTTVYLVLCSYTGWTKDSPQGKPSNFQRIGLKLHQIVFCFIELKIVNRKSYSVR